MKRTSHIGPPFARLRAGAVPTAAWVACGYCLFLVFVLG